MSAIEDKVADMAANGFESGSPLDVEQFDEFGRSWQRFEFATYFAELDATVWMTWGAVDESFHRSGGVAAHGFPTAAQLVVEGVSDMTVWEFASGSRIYEFVTDPPSAAALSATVDAAFWNEGGPAGMLGVPLQDSSVDPGGSGEAGVFAGGTLFANSDGTVVVEPAGTPTPTPTPMPVGHVPARAMTVDDAWAEVVALHRSGALVLADHPPAMASSDIPPTRQQVRLKPSVIHGVEFKYWDGTRVMRHGMEQVDVRNVVALARLAAWVSANYGTSVVYHLGLSGSADRSDCHGKGRALDFAGVQGTLDGVEYDWQVLRDWGRKSVPNESDPAGARRADWPPGRRDLSFRLDANPDADAAIAAFFQALYDFCADEWQDLDDQPSAATTHSVIGTRSFIMNPDHPASDPNGPHGRQAHRNHLHLQIGTT